jgi:hypothetical protein
MPPLVFNSVDILEKIKSCPDPINWVNNSNLLNGMNAWDLNDNLEWACIFIGRLRFDVDVYKDICLSCFERSNIKLVNDDPIIDIINKTKNDEMINYSQAEVKKIHNESLKLNNCTFSTVENRDVRNYMIAILFYIKAYMSIKNNDLSLFENENHNILYLIFYYLMASGVPKETIMSIIKNRITWAMIEDQYKSKFL